MGSFGGRHPAMLGIIESRLRVRLGLPLESVPVPRSAFLDPVGLDLGERQTQGIPRADLVRLQHSSHAVEGNPDADGLSRGRRALVLYVHLIVTHVSTLANNQIPGTDPWIRTVDWIRDLIGCTS